MCFSLLARCGLRLSKAHSFSAELKQNAPFSGYRHFRIPQLPAACQIVPEGEDWSHAQALAEHGEAPPFDQARTRRERKESDRLWEVISPAGGWGVFQFVQHAFQAPGIVRLYRHTF